MVVEPEKAREGVVHADTTEARRQCHPIWLVPTPALGKQASGTEAQRQRQRSMSNRAAEYEERVQLHTALQSAVYCKLALTLAKDTDHFGTEEGQLTVLRHGGEDPSYMQRARGRRETSCCNIV